MDKNGSRKVFFKIFIAHTILMTLVLGWQDTLADKPFFSWKLAYVPVLYGAVMGTLYVYTRNKRLKKEAAAAAAAEAMKAEASQKEA